MLGRPHVPVSAPRRVSISSRTCALTAAVLVHVSAPSGTAMKAMPHVLQYLTCGLTVQGGISCL
eukprot:10989405-Heterocapsa_arctica.AAC.1